LDLLTLEHETTTLSRNFGRQWATDTAPHSSGIDFNCSAAEAQNLPFFCCGVWRNCVLVLHYHLTNKVLLPHGVTVKTSGC